MAEPSLTGDVPPARVAVQAEPPVVFFDGECGLCNRFVQWLIAHDTERVLQFAPLQGELAGQKLPALPEDIHEWSMALWDETGVYSDSDASLRSVARVGGLWRGALVLRFVPRIIRDRVYRYVARKRIRWFGRVETCALLSAEDRARLLP